MIIEMHFRENSQMTELNLSSSMSLDKNRCWNIFVEFFKYDLLSNGNFPIPHLSLLVANNDGNKYILLSPNKNVENKTQDTDYFHKSILNQSYFWDKLYSEVICWNSENGYNKVN